MSRDKGILVTKKVVFRQAAPMMPQHPNWPSGALGRRRIPQPTGGVMWDWLRRSRMGTAEGRIIAITASTCLQQRREQGDVGEILSGNPGAIAPSPSAARGTPRMEETPSTAPLGPVPEGLRGMLPCGGLGQSRTLRVWLLYEGRRRAFSVRSGPGGTWTAG